MGALLLADHADGVLNAATGKALTAALKLGVPVDILVCGDSCAPVAQAAAQYAGVRKILVAEAAQYKHLRAEPVADLIVSLAGNYSHILAPATSFGKNTLPRVAALLDVMQISDITAVISADTFERPIYAGNAIETVQSGEAKKIITVRGSAFDAPAMGGSAAIESAPAAGDFANSKFVKSEIVKATRPDLGAARVVVSGGRALGSADAFKTVIEPLADSLNAAIGASRAAVDAGFAANDLQVGQTGKVVAPELYIAVGISGAIQHLAGMKDSKVIVAINKDANAPIFGVADYGLVADLFEAVPQLTAALK